MPVAPCIRGRRLTVFRLPTVVARSSGRRCSSCTHVASKEIETVDCFGRHAASTRCTCHRSFRRSSLKYHRPVDLQLFLGWNSEPICSATANEECKHVFPSALQLDVLESIH